MNSIMVIDPPLQNHHNQQHHQEEEDPFVRFIDYARSVLSPEDDEDFDPNINVAETRRPSWNWIASRVLKTCATYSSGVTAAILLSDLSQAWNEQHRDGALKKRPELVSQLRKKHRRGKLQNTVTIDSLHEKNFLSLNSVLEAVIVNSFVLPGTNIFMLTLGDYWSSNTIDLYLHRRYYDLVDIHNGILKKGREILLTGCYLRCAAGQPRLLPTEYLVILLDEDDDDDAMLLGAQFCSDSFSSITLDAVNQGVSYSLFASVGSMLALDRPYVASSLESAIEASGGLCLEYGSATQLYLVPFIQHEEQVSVTLTQNPCQGSGLLSTIDLTVGQKISQVSLPRDSKGSIDFSSYPFQSFVVDLQDKMTGISLYGVVTNIKKETNTSVIIFLLRVEDATGAICAKLHFLKSWSLGRLSIGHTVYISGLTCSLSKQKCLEALWFENDVGSSFTNLSFLPALLNSSCLQKLSSLSSLSSQASCPQIVQVWLEMAYCKVSTRFSHAICGHLVDNAPGGVIRCRFCCYNCDVEVTRTFILKITVADNSGKISAWCTGQTATELLQISPDEFYELLEEEQVMYPTSLEKERFMVALVYCQRQSNGLNDSLMSENEGVSWEITRALKYQ